MSLRLTWPRRIAAYTLLILGLTLSFWFSPAPRTEAEYCGTYLHLTPWAGFTANCDGFVYMEDARHPARLLESGEVRQSRPLFILLGSVVGYPCTWAVQVAQASGLLPARVVQKLPVKYQPLLGFYVGYVLLNYTVLLAALLLFRYLYYRFTAQQGSSGILAGLFVFLVSNQVTKAFFWTVHQQMFTFLVPLVLVYVAAQLHTSAQWRQQLPLLAVVGGLLSLVYGSFVLVLPVLLYGLWLQRAEGSRLTMLGWAPLLMLLFAVPTLAWIGILRLQGVAYYNHEAAAYGQVVWLQALWQQPFPAFWQLLSVNFGKFLSTLPAIGPFAATALLGGWAFGRRQRPHFMRLLFGVTLLLIIFLVGLGYYKERLTWMLVPVLLLMIGASGAVQQRPVRFTAGLLGAAGAWHLWQVVAYGPFS
ncbi:hypothetical protein [Hymenobacter metallilatus]|uniref:Glycosyltransferase RgtA/B/C/D-like domain-containing protein n=1 Tax=Hymenobacter metallilatus TaxID=2493666 RepID=A0A3R9NM32_9BACT|nr:hypothetical protein [Hymenobacter metallilatus]RSK37134.1 hypothetical protein EI290_00250 [Hymenobacter metallilatus]